MTIFASLARRTSVGITLLAAALLVCGSAAADTRSACIAACDATAQTCMRTAHETYEACKPAARTACAPKPSAEQFDCLSTAGRTCSRTHSTQTEPCRATFTACYAACGPRPATQVDFWCELNADAPTGAGKTYKDAFCAGTPGQAALDQHARCMKLFTPSDPAIGFSLDCDALR
jgi:hypothetical protein